MHATTVLCALLVASPALAHMSIWSKSMYGVGNGFSYDAGNPVVPIGPGLDSQDEWWFRGPSFRALAPAARSDGAVEQLPAGGSITFEIACHVDWTSLGRTPTVPGSHLDACPTDVGAYHAGDPTASDVDFSLVSGCALAIADVDDISKVTMDNLAIFSVQHQCIQQKQTSFDIPAKMPACTGSKCICGWFWLANNGTGNFYMTAFDCAVTNSPADALPIAPPQDPVFCRDNPSSCTTGSKRPLYAYNSPSNAPFVDNYNRAGYHASWSFPTNGAQNDIFAKATNVTVTSASSSAVSTAASSSSSASVAASSSSVVVSSASSTVAPSVASSSSAIPSSTIVSSTVSSAAPIASAVAPLKNYARGTATGASTWIDNGEPQLAVDGDMSTAWISNGETVNAWIAFDFGTNIAMNQIVLNELSSSTDHITNCAIMLSSKEMIWLGPLNNDGSATTFNFTTRYTSSLYFGVFGVSDTTDSVGLSELQVFNNPSATIGAAATVPAASATSAAAALSSAAVSATGGTPGATASATSTSSSAPAATTTALTNYALSAQKAASSWIGGWDPAKAADGKTYTTWVTNNELAGSWFGLQFSGETTINQVVLYGRPSASQQVTNCAIQFSDQSILPLGPLNADGSATTFNFTAKSTSSLFWGALAVTSSATQVGLAEIQVFNNPSAVVKSPALPAQSSAAVVASIQAIAADTVSAVTSIVGDVVSAVLPSSTAAASTSAASASAVKRALLAAPRHPRDFSRRDAELDSAPEPQTTAPARRSLSAESLFVGISPVWDAPVDSASA
ncbi:hypothetical protein JCM8208_006246 [Rhodotorula glutinis]